MLICLCVLSGFHDFNLILRHICLCVPRPSTFDICLVAALERKIVCCELFAFKLCKCGIDVGFEQVDAYAFCKSKNNEAYASKC